MFPHHERALEAATRRLREEPDVLAILVAGSIARGVEREDSDIDLMVVVTQEGQQQRQERGQVSFLWKDVADYPGGYVEGRFLALPFLEQAAERGSEPTRHSFTRVYPVYSVTSDIADLVSRIPVYPEHERQHRIDAFMAQLRLNRWYFWSEGKRAQDPYLLTRTASEIVLFGGRLILAHNRILFPCQRRLREYMANAPEKPERLIELADALLTSLTDENKEGFCQAVEGFTDWGVKSDLLSRYLQDVEMSWYTGSHAISEW